MKNDYGFTLLELIVVMTLLAIISAAVVPLYATSMAALQVRSSSNDFISLLTFVQEKAVAESRHYRLCLDDEAGAYWVEAAVQPGDESEEGEGETEEKPKKRGRNKDWEPEYKPIAAEYGQKTYLPEYLKIDRVKARKDRENKTYYIVCFPSGACDIARVRFQDERSRNRNFEVETLGTMGKIKVKKKGDRVVE